MQTGSRRSAQCLFAQFGSVFTVFQPFLENQFGDARDILSNNCYIAIAKSSVTVRRSAFARIFKHPVVISESFPLRQGFGGQDVGLFMAIAISNLK